MISLQVNGKAYQVDVDPDMPLLWVLRDRLGLMGTKYGCGRGFCGACTVHVNGNAVRSCVTRVSSASGKEIITIEGFSEGPGMLVQKAWLMEDVPQCGYCQPGQIMQAAALLRKNPDPGDADIDAAMTGVLCRCGTYQRIRRAIRTASRLMAEGAK